LNSILKIKNTFVSSKVVLIIELKKIHYAVSDTAFACFDLKPEYMSSTTGSVANGTF